MSRPANVVPKTEVERRRARRVVVYTPPLPDGAEIIPFPGPFHSIIPAPAAVQPPLFDLPAAAPPARARVRR